MSCLKKARAVNVEASGMSETQLPQVLALTNSDLLSPTWAKLRKHLQGRVEALRNELEQDLPEEKTAKVRGRLAEVMSLLSLEKNLPPE